MGSRVSRLRFNQSEGFYEVDCRRAGRDCRLTSNPSAAYVGRVAAAQYNVRATGHVANVHKPNRINR